MKPSEALKIHRDAVLDAAKARQVTNVRVFGSALHGLDEEGSDLDILVDALPSTSLFDLGGLQVDLEEMLGVPVDLLTPGDVPPEIRDSVIREAKKIEDDNGTTFRP